MKPLVVFLCLFLTISSSPFCYFAATYTDQHVLISNKIVIDELECKKLCTDDDTCAAVSLVSRDGKNLCALLGDKIVGKVCMEATEVLEKRDCPTVPPRVEAGQIWDMETGRLPTTIMNGDTLSETEWLLSRTTRVTVYEGCSILIQYPDGDTINCTIAGDYKLNVPNGFTKATASCN